MSKQVGGRRPRRATRPQSGEPAAPGQPDQTSDDTDAGWGETPPAEENHERWLQEQRPPHWG